MRDKEIRLIKRLTMPLTLLILLIVVFFLVAIFSSGGTESRISRISGTPIKFLTPHLEVVTQNETSVDSYRGLGTWVDSFDADPSYMRGSLTVIPSDLKKMSQNSVRTIFLQGSRSQDRSGELISRPWYLTEFLLNAHSQDMKVVAWYLPMWSADKEDLNRLTALNEFEVLGHKFDGLAVDIEWNQDGLEALERSKLLIELSAGLRKEVGNKTLGAIVMPPVITEVINPNFWPDFPWEELEGFYDVWLPMSYWSFRTEEHADSFYYSDENIRLLREKLRNKQALVHSIGGVGLADGTAPSRPRRARSNN